MKLGIILAAVLVCGVFAPLAHADRFSEWLEVWKKEEEQRAIQYQKDILHFDYSKIQNKDPGFKTTNVTDVKKKHIQNDAPVNFKIIRQNSTD